MQKKTYSYLSLLGVLAVLTPITGQPDWLGFLGFLGFSAFSKAKSDERTVRNFNRAARNAYFISMGGMTVVFGLMAAGIGHETLQNALIALFMIMTVSFSLSYAVYNRRGE